LLILPHGRRIHRQAQSSLHAAELPGDVATAEPHRRDRQLVALDDGTDGWMTGGMDGRVR
jgi:hypothetical protein